MDQVLIMEQVKDIKGDPFLDNLYFIFTYEQNKESGEKNVEYVVLDQLRQYIRTTLNRLKDQLEVLAIINPIQKEELVPIQLID